MYLGVHCVRVQKQLRLSGVLLDIFLATLTNDVESGLGCYIPTTRASHTHTSDRDHQRTGIADSTFTMKLQINLIKNDRILKAGRKTTM